MLQKRNVLSKLEIYKKSLIIQQKIINSLEFKSANVVGAYFPIGSEVRTQDVINAVLRNHKTVALPRMEGDQIIFYQIKDIIFDENKLINSSIGVKEPTKSATNIVENFDILIVPGVAFDNNGHRLGYGKGYYDRFIKKKKHFFTVGLAFEFQLLDRDLPYSNFDQKVNAVATEKRILHF
jgi:5-formyltetrahydrofolate cyclo-ligase